MSEAEPDDEETRRARKIAATARDFETAAARAIEAIFAGGREAIRAQLATVRGQVTDALAGALAEAVQTRASDAPVSAEDVNAVLSDAGVSGVLRALKASELRRAVDAATTPPPPTPIRPPRSPSGDGTA